MGLFLLVTTKTFFGIPHWSPKDVYRFYVDEGRHVLFLSTTYTTNKTEGDDDKITVADAFIALFAFSEIVSTRFHYATVLGALFISSFTIWTATNNFIKEINYGHIFQEKQVTDVVVGKTLNLKQLCEKYGELVHLSHATNEMWGGLCFWAILDMCVWLCSDLEVVLHFNNYVYLMYDITAMVYLVLSLVLSAECYRKVSTSLCNFMRKIVLYNFI